MANERDELREKIRRYQDLHAFNSDPQARRILEELIKELEATLDETKQPSPTPATGRDRGRSPFRS